MIKLDLTNEQQWLDLGRGLRIRVAPPVSTIAAQVWAEMAAAGAFDESDGVDGDKVVDAGVLEAKAWARRVIDAWEGVGDEHGNELASPTPETIDALLDVPWVYLAFRTLYLAPLHAVESEKNVSSPSLNGSSEGARNTARRAKGRARSARDD